MQKQCCIYSITMLNRNFYIYVTSVGHSIIMYVNKLGFRKFVGGINVEFLNSEISRFYINLKGN